MLGKRLLPDGQATEMLKNRVKDAVALYEQLLGTHPSENIKIIMCGGKVQKGPKVPTEATLMQKLALQYIKPSLPAPHIVLEDESLNTIQNALNAKDYLEDFGIKEMYLITTEFHMERSVKIFEIALGLGYKIHAHISHTKMAQKELDDERKLEVRAIAGLKSRFWSMYRIPTLENVTVKTVVRDDPMDVDPSPQQQPAKPIQTQPEQKPVNNNNNNNTAPPQQKKKKKKVVLSSTKSAREDECKVCFEASVNAVLVPCGHLAMCYKCAELIAKSSNKCPICRTDVKSLMKTFKA